MKRFLLAGASVALLAASASAADLPSRTRQPYAPVVAASAPAMGWTGLYAGLNAGYTFSGSSDASFSGAPGVQGLIATGLFPVSVSGKYSGFIGGAQLGYNHQIGQFVIGAETDIMYRGGNISKSFVTPLNTAIALKRDSGWLGTTRLRAGFAPIDRLLVYGTGGLAYGSTDATISATVPGIGGAAWTGGKSDTKVGYAVGAGAEYAITNNVSAKLEYLYYDLGSANASLAAVTAAATGIAPIVKVENKGHIVRAGVNYKF